MSDVIADRIMTMLPILDERQKRIYLAKEAQGLGYGGISAVAKLTGVSRTTITVGISEIENSKDLQSDGIRKKGGGRKKVIDVTPEITEKIENILDNTTYGNPENPLSYTTMSTRKIELELQKQGFDISHTTVGDILKALKYSLQQNQKMLQVGEPHPDRNEQFEFINTESDRFLTKGEPIISIDCKKKELIGNFANNGSSYRKTGEGVKVLDHDFPIEELGKVAPYGIYDVDKNIGFVNLGISSDTAEFAVESISRWWLSLGKNTYPNAKEIYITADGGGSNSYRNRLFKLELQEFANQSGLEVHVSHFPRGTSKWNKIEHRMFCYISSHWRGQPLINVETVINLIGSTTTTKGLKITCVKDDNKYDIGIKVSDEDFAKINLKEGNKFPNWNYIINPQ